MGNVKMINNMIKAYEYVKLTGNFKYRVKFLFFNIIIMVYYFSLKAVKQTY